MTKSLRLIAAAFAAMLLIGVSTMPAVDATRIEPLQHTDIDLPGGA